MATTPADKTKMTEFAIFARVLSNHKADMSPPLARYVLTLGFSADEQARMDDLAVRNQDGRLTPDEHEELMSYVRAGHLLALLHSKARKALKKRKVS
ncbi:MAG TPA: hypothetical protein VGY58_08130 [Gemmataceae bacterium]|jgi:hypothetical protein|nr:hypothetical protein [Gemmataceae bacterium]